MQLRARMAPWLWLTPAGALLIPFFVIPVLITARNSVYRDDPMGFLTPAFTFDSYARVLSDPYYLGVFGNTLVAAAIVSSITLMVAYPFAWLLARSSGSSRGFPALGGLPADLCQRHHAGIRLDGGDRRQRHVESGID